VPDLSALPDTLDSVLRKYGKMWIWSILSVAVAALSARNITSLSDYPRNPKSRCANAFRFGNTTGSLLAGAPNH